MVSKKRSHSRRPKSKRPAPDTTPEPLADPWGDTELLKRNNRSQGAFTAGELGQPDQVPEPGDDNPQAVQGGEGPLGQSGQGNRQNDEFAEMEELEPDLRLDPRGRDRA